MPILDLGAKPTAEFAILWVGVAVPWEGRCQAQRGISLVAGSRGHPAARSQGRGQGPGDCESAPALGVSLYPKGHDIKEHMKTLQQVKREDRERDHGTKDKVLYFRIFDSICSLLFKQEAPQSHLEKHPTHFIASPTTVKSVGC